MQRPWGQGGLSEEQKGGPCGWRVVSSGRGVQFIGKRIYNRMDSISAQHLSPGPGTQPRLSKCNNCYEAFKVVGAAFAAPEAELWDVPWPSDVATGQVPVVGTSAGPGSGRPRPVIFLRSSAPCRHPHPPAGNRAGDAALSCHSPEQPPADIRDSFIQ